MRESKKTKAEKVPTVKNARKSAGKNATVNDDAPTTSGVADSGVATSGVADSGTAAPTSSGSGVVTRDGAARKEGALRSHKGALWSVSIVSGLVAVALTTASFLGSPFVSTTDTAGTGARVASQQVSQTLLTGYCPAQLGLEDQESYGDSAFSVSEGNLTSAVRYSAIGSVYEASAADPAKEKTETLTSVGNDILTLGGLTAATSSVMSSTLLGAEDGTGATATVSSWASEGDVQGLASSSCVESSLESSFVVPSTQTGTTATLVVANSADKPTTVSIRYWGSQSAGELAASTGSTLTVGAHAEKTVEIAAAAPDQEGVFLTVSSTVVPVYSVVKVSAASGLTSKGADYLTPVDSTTNDAVLTGFEPKQSAVVRAYSATDQEMILSWMGSDGVKGSQTATLTAHQVTVVDMGAVPDGATSLMVTSADPVFTSAVASVSSGDQSDFAFIQSGSAVAHSALTIPDGVEAALTLANSTDSETAVTLEGFDASGASVGSKQVSVGPQSSQNVKLSDIGDAVRTVSLTAEDAADSMDASDTAADAAGATDASGDGAEEASDSETGVTMAARLSVESLSKAHIAQASVVGATSLMPRKATVAATRSLLASVK